MAFLYLCIFAFIITYSIFVKKSIYNPLLLFAFCWCIFPIITDLGAVGLYKPSINTHACIILSISAFVLTYMVFPKYRSRNTNVSNYVNRKVLIYTNLLSWVFLVPYTIKAIGMANIYGLEYLRDIASTEQLIASTQLQVIYNWFIMPLYLVTAIFACIFVVDGKFRENKMLLVVSIISIVLHSITFAARALLVKFIFYFVFALFFVEVKQTKVFKKDYFKVFSIIIGLMLVTVLISIGRSSRSFLETFLIYYAGPFSLFDYYLNHPQIASLTSEAYLFGKAIFGCIYNIYQSALYVVLHAEYAGSDYIITQFTALAAPVGMDISMNAATTAMYPFMRDFGYLGIIFGFSMMAMLIWWSERKVIMKPTYRNKAVYIALLYVIFKLSMSYELMSPSMTFLFVYIILFTQDKITIKY